MERAPFTSWLEERKMEKCKICESEGIEIEFKDGRGLGLHLKAKHNGMKLDDYREKYGGGKVEAAHEKPETPIEEPETPKTSDETPQEIIIRDYKLLNKSNLSAMFVKDGIIDSFRKVVAIGTIEVNNTSVVSAMIIGDDGLLTPTFVVPEFARIVEGEIRLPSPQKKKPSFFSKYLKKKSKKIPKYKKKPDENMSQELIEQFSKYLHDKKVEEEEK